MMKNIFLVLILISMSDFINAQEFIGAHEYENNIYGIHKNIQSKFDPEGKDIIPLNKNSIKQLSGAVFGYLPDWEYNNGAHQFMRYDLLTHVACFDFNVSSSGSVSLPAAWPWTDVINAAHQNGTKIILTAVNFNNDEIRAIITNETAKNNFFNQVKNIITTYSMDGVNIDFESLYNDDKGVPIVNFMSELTTFIHTELPGKEVSFAGPAVNWGDHWDLPGLAASCDYIFIMGYAFSGSWSSVTGANSPLVSGSINITNTINIEYGQVATTNPEKIILGIPYYGHHWITADSNPGSSINQFIGSTRFNSTKPQSQVYGNLWHASKTPWYNWNDGLWHQIWHDDDSSLGLKYDLAINKNLMGVGMWALGYDKGRDELWNLIDWKFGSGEISPPEKPYYFSVLAENDSSLRLIYDYPLRATGFEIYQSFDGLVFSDSFNVSSNDVLITGLEKDSVYYFKIKSTNENGESALSEVLAGIPSNNETKILVVNGFDRTSGTTNSLDLIRKYSEPFINNGYSFSSASNEAVFRGEIPLQNADIVFWMLGDESTTDETFNVFEQEILKSYLNSGGKLFVSGSEIGWDLGRSGSSSANDISFYENYLKADYLSDAPNGTAGVYYTAEGLSQTLFEGVGEFNFDDGNHGTFDVDYPDAIRGINGGTDILQFKNVSLSLGGAGVAFEGLFPNGSLPGKLVHLSIPFETIYPAVVRTELLGKVLEFFNSPATSVENIFLPNEFLLHQNFPNPFNPNTTIEFVLPENGNVKIEIFNSIGQSVNSNTFENMQNGYHSYNWTAVGNNGDVLSSGIYIYRVSFTGSKGVKYIQSKKMVLLK